MNKVVLITGASRGIGKAIALKYAKEGYDVVINFNRNINQANEVLNECLTYGVDGMVYQGDVSSFEQVESMVKQVMEKFGRIDVLVNNSGITKDNLLLKMSPQDFNDVIATNLVGVFNTVKLVSKIMIKQRSGVIINLASVVGISGNIGQANYAASKAGVIGFTKSIAKELAGRNIRVNAIAPGFIATDMTDKIPDNAKDFILNQIALKKMGQGKDIASLAYFLSSDEGSYITGQVINVDGGMVI